MFFWKTELPQTFRIADVCEKLPFNYVSLLMPDAEFSEEKMVLEMSLNCLQEVVIKIAVANY